MAKDENEELAQLRAEVAQLRETNRLLQAGNVSSLYCKNRRDAILIFCIDHELSLAKTNETLFDFGEAVLGD